MATIKSAIQLYDNVSPALRAMNKAMNIAVGSFEALNTASSNAIDVNAIAQMRSELTRAEVAFDQVGQEIQDAAQAQQNFNNDIRNGSTAASNLKSKFMGLAGTIGSLIGLKKIFDLSDTMTQTTARLDMMNDGLQTTEELQRMIFAAAQRSRGSYQGSADAISKMGIMAKDAFNSNAELVAFVEQLNKQFTIAGTSQEGISAAMLQLTQAMGSGVLRGEELNSVFEQAPTIIQSIADYLDVPIGQIRKMAQEGQISADVVKSALLSTAEETNKKFESMPKTIGQVWQSIKNQALMSFQPILQKINEIVNSEKFTRLADSAVGAISTIAAVAVTAFDAIASIGKFIYDNWNWIEPIVIGVVGAFLAYNAVALVTNAINGILAFSDGVKAAAMAMSTGTTFAATAAQTSFNAALWACPITWIIALIIGLIVVFIIFTEQIVGAIWWLGALFKNIGLWIANVAIGVWNSIKNIGLWFANLGLSIWAVFQNIGFAIANFFLGIFESVKAIASNIGTAFSNAWIWIQITFWKLVDGIMQGLKSIAEFANTCLGWMGVNIDTSGLDFAKEKIQALSDQYKEYQDIGDAWDKGSSTFEYVDVGAAFNTNDIDWGKGWNDGYNTFDVFEDGWGSEAYGAGAEIGAGIHDSIMGVFDLFPGGEAADSLDAYNFGNSLDGILGNTADIAGSTGSMADSMEMSGEDLKYLRDIAERETINRFTTAEISVDMTNNNNISSDMDIDGVVEALEEKVYEAMVISAEGVHE